MLTKCLAIGGIVLASLMYGSKAQAQYCGSGEIQQGGGSGTYVGCIPIQQPQQPQYDSRPSSGSSSGSSPVSLPKHIRDFDDYNALRNSDYGYSFIAVAVHPNNKDDVWATWNQRNEPKAVQTALSACNQAMGQGCVLLVKSWNVSTTVVRGQTNLWYASQSTPQQAREEALRACRASDRGCEVVHTFVSEPLKQPKTRNNEEYAKILQDPAFDVSKSYLPKPRGFLAIAWTGLSSQTWQNLVVASGYPTAQEAEKAAINRCQTESKQACSSFGVADDRKYPMFAVYLHGQKQAYWYSNRDEKNLERMAVEHCRETGVSCQKVGVFDARRSSVLIHPIRK